MNNASLNLSLSKWTVKPCAETRHLLPDELVFPPSGIPAQVPGDIYLDLLRAGLIDNPFFSRNELSLSWIAQCDWEYETVFYTDDPDFTHLVFEGLDTIADISLNGHMLGRTQNMFVRYLFKISNRLNLGEKNILTIRFHSALSFSEKSKTPIKQLPYTLNPDRVFIRKAQYSFGWDWGPGFPGVGIWKEVLLIRTNRPRIEHVYFETTSLENNCAFLKVKVSFDKPVSPDYDIQIKLSGHNQILLKASPGDNTKDITCILQLDYPMLWWPHNMGPPHLYSLDVSLLTGQGAVVEKCVKHVGIRKTELLLKDGQRDAFTFRINNRPLFMKGANWIPADSFLPRVDKQKYRELILSARDANMNVLRVWGGGIYEADVFYEQCDLLGIMVWQDFMFACATYPDDPPFLENIREEVTQNVNRLQSHPSIVLWCGNNEIEWTWHAEYGSPLDKMQGYELFHTLIPAWLKTLDPGRPYWPSSPFGNDPDPNSMTSGNRHAWDIWSKWIDYKKVYTDKSLFVSEFGFQAPATHETFKTVLPENTREVQTEPFEFHNKQDDGNERLFRFLSAHFPVKTEIESFIFLTQLNQGLALKTCIEHWRSRWPKTSGSIIWQLNDCWPVSGWSLIDYELRRKHAYYFTRHSFSNILPLFIPDGQQVKVAVSNDGHTPFGGKAMLYIWDFDSQDGYFDEEFSISVANGDMLFLKNIANDTLGRRCLIITLLDDENNQVARNFYLTTPWKYLALPKAEYHMEVAAGENQLIVTAVSVLFFLKTEHPDVEMDDLPEIMLPGEVSKLTAIRGDLSQDSMQALKINCLNDHLYNP